MTFDQAKQILAAFAREGVRYSLVGSMALAVHGIVRATGDIDFFIDPATDNVERLKRALHSLFNDPCIDEISASDFAGDYPAIRYIPPDGSFAMDILARLGEAFTFPDIITQVIQVDGLLISVATPRMLFNMKKDTVRPQDKADAHVLAERFNLKGS